MLKFGLALRRITSACHNVAFFLSVWPLDLSYDVHAVRHVFLPFTASRAQVGGRFQQPKNRTLRHEIPSSWDLWSFQISRRFKTTRRSSTYRMHCNPKMNILEIQDPITPNWIIQHLIHGGKYSYQVYQLKFCQCALGPALWRFSHYTQYCVALCCMELLTNVAK